MQASRRTKVILELASRDEGATYEEIAEACRMSVQTARKDCSALSKQGLITLRIRQIPEVYGTPWGEKHVWRIKCADV